MKSNRLICDVCGKEFDPAGFLINPKGFRFNVDSPIPPETQKMICLAINKKYKDICEKCEDKINSKKLITKYKIETIVGSAINLIIAKIDDVCVLHKNKKGDK